MKATTTHYIDGVFVESYGREVTGIINSTNDDVTANVSLGDREDAREAIAAVKRAFDGFGRSTKEAHIEVLQSLQKAVSPRAEDLTNVMTEECGGVRKANRATAPVGLVQRLHQARQLLLQVEGAYALAYKRHKRGQLSTLALRNAASALIRWRATVAKLQPRM